MEEVIYYVIDNNNNIVYSGNYDSCKEYILEANYPLILISEIEYK